MGTKLLALFAVLFMGAQVLEAYTYQTYNLNDYCGLTLKLPCRREASNRAGTLKYSTYPTRNCSVTVTVDTSAAECYSYYTYKVYFNVKVLSLYQQDKVEIRTPNSYNYPSYYTVEKTLPGGTGVFTARDPTSVAQYLTDEATTPTFTIAFVKGPATTAPSSDSLTLDYNVVHTRSVFGSSNIRDTDTYCSALSGYVLDELYCDHSDRVNCPGSRYYDASDDSNFAISIDKTYSSPCSLSPGTIVGIVFGSIAGVIFVAVLTSIFCRRSRQRVVHRHVPGVSVPVVNQYAAQVVVTQGGYAAYPQQQAYGGNIPGAPPAYTPYATAGQGVASNNAVPYPTQHS
ncbi:hypothetical protein BV898_06305 [Hypsibius exemplaris]|uniref:CUB domain-containing protein n=1 Tax=Hypsibius exemplaris TaxID=2072580 RepID=A0A1W0WX74_HYPEX|nr:hypothetical protein BV898_06305 [Hypsibius exemplaris]